MKHREGATFDHDLWIYAVDDRMILKTGQPVPEGKWYDSPADHLDSAPPQSVTAAPEPEPAEPEAEPESEAAPPPAFTDMTDDELRGFIEGRDGKVPHHRLGRARLLALATIA